MKGKTTEQSMRPGGRRPRSGSVLLPVLAVLAAVVVLVLHMQMRASTAMRGAESLAIMTQLRAAAADTAWMMVQRLADEEHATPVHSGQAWAEPLDVTRADGILVRARTFDEQAGFDVNNMTVPQVAPGTRQPAFVLANILAVCGDEDAVARVRALRGAMVAREFGVEGDAGGGHDRAHPPRPLLSLGELAAVRGWGPEFLTRPLPVRNAQEETALMWSVVTVGPDTRHRLVPVNLNTAPREVLLGLLGEEWSLLIDVLLDMRETSPLPSMAGLRAMAPEHVLAPIAEYLDVRSTRFRVEVVAEHRGRQTQLAVWAERNSPGNVQITGWVE